MCVLAGVLLSVVTIGIDRWADFEAVPRWLTGGPEAATAILETIAASMVSLAALVLTITMVVVQLAMGQFSPRIVQTFLQDRPSQLAIGLFVATFAHAMLTLREVHFEEGGQVPGIGDHRGLRPGVDEHRGARDLRAPHRPITACFGADRTGRE